MFSSDARVVRGLSIANIILSSLAIVGAVITLAFTVLNALLLWLRISVENKALQSLTAAPR